MLQLQRRIYNWDYKFDTTVYNVIVTITSKKLVTVITNLLQLFAMWMTESQRRIYNCDYKFDTTVCNVIVTKKNLQLWLQICHNCLQCNCNNYK